LLGQSTSSDHSAIYILRKAFEHTELAYLKDQPFSLALSIHAKASSQDTSYHYQGITTYQYRKGYVGQHVKFLRRYREMAENPISGISQKLLSDRRFWGGIFLEDRVEPPCSSGSRSCWNKNFPDAQLKEVTYKGRKVYHIHMSLPVPKGAWLEGAYLGKPLTYELSVLVEAGTYIILKKEILIYGENRMDQDKKADPLLKDYKRTDRIWVSIEKEYVNFLGNYFLAHATTTYQTQYVYPELAKESEIYTTQHAFITDRINLNSDIALPPSKHIFHDEWVTIGDHQPNGVEFVSRR
ncbi:MAG: hypothetical protein AAF824_06255, partial [Bacteroidota bacterium]